MLFKCVPGGGSSVGKKTFPHEETNMTVVPDTPDGYGAFTDLFLYRTSSSACQLLI